MDHLPVRRIHISSEFKVRGGTHSDFTIALGQTVSLPDDTVAFVDNVSLDNTFYTVTLHHNDLLYIAEKFGNQYFLRTIQLAHGNYSGLAYAFQLKTKLNAAGHASLLGFYDVVYSMQEGTVAVTTSSGYTFAILSDEQIQAHDGTGGLTIDKNNPRSGNRVLGNSTNGNTSSSPSGYIFSASFKSVFLSLLSVQQVFIHSNLADNNVLSCRGLSDCICAVPISSSFGSTVHHNMTSQADAINVSKRSFDSLRFQLRDAHGNILETNGGKFSCSIIFMQKI